MLTKCLWTVAGVLALGGTTASAAIVSLSDDRALVTNPDGSGGWVGTGSSSTANLLRVGEVQTTTSGGNLRRGALKFSVELAPNEVITSASLEMFLVQRTSASSGLAFSVYHSLSDNSTPSGNGVFELGTYADTGEDIIKTTDTATSGLFSVDVTSELLAEFAGSPTGPQIVAFRIQLDGDLTQVSNNATYPNVYFRDSGDTSAAVNASMPAPTLVLTTSIIPEPASLALGALGLAMIAKRRRHG
jgi:hypothetical protein